MIFGDSEDVAKVLAQLCPDLSYRETPTAKATTMEGCESVGTRPRYLIVGRAYAGHDKVSRAWKTWLYIVLIDCCLAESLTQQHSRQIQGCDCVGCTKNSSDIEILSLRSTLSDGYPVHRARTEGDMG